MLRLVLAASQPATRLQVQQFTRLRLRGFRCRPIASCRPPRRFSSTAADGCRKGPSPAAATSATPDCTSSSTSPPMPPPPPSSSGGAPSIAIHPATFDTLQLHSALSAAGLTASQAAAITSAFASIVQHVSEGTAASTPSKVDFASLRAELQLLEKADVATMRSDVALVERKLETAVAKLYTELERSENRTTRWVFGAAATVTALAMTFLRLSTGFGGGGGGRGGGGGPVGGAPAAGGGGHVTTSGDSGGAECGPDRTLRPLQQKVDLGREAGEPMAAVSLCT